MKKFIAALCVSVTACSGNSATDLNGQDGVTSQSELSEAAVDAEPIGAMLKEGRPEACAHPAVEARLFADATSDGLPTPQAVMQSWTAADVTEQDIADAAAEVGDPSFSDFQAIKADPAVGALACGVNITVKDTTYNLYYLLRPSLENERDFFLAYRNSNPSYLRTNAISSRAHALAAARLPPEPEWKPSWERDEDSNAAATPGETVNAM